RPERDHGVDAAARDHAAHDLRQLPRAGAAHDGHVVGTAAGSHDRVQRTGDQRLDDQAVEPAGDDREPEPSRGQGAFDGVRHAPQIYTIVAFAIYWASRRLAGARPGTGTRSTTSMPKPSRPAILRSLHIIRRIRCSPRSASTWAPRPKSRSASLESLRMF